MNRNGILLIVFGLLFLVFVWNQFFSSSESRNFKEVLVELDTAQVTKISIIPKASSAQNLDLIRIGSAWEVTDGVVKDEADNNLAKGMLSSLVSIKPKRLVAKSDKKWAQYEVNDSLGTKVKVYNGDQLLADFVVGKFNFQQATRSMSTFVRLTDEEEVYSVEGFLSSTFNQQFSNLRDKTLLSMNKEDLTSIKFNYPADSSFALTKVGDAWSLNGAPVDSVAMQTFLNALQNMTMSEFNDSFNVAGQLASYQITLEVNNMDALVIRGFGEAENLILHSSQNENAYFNKGNVDVFDKLFVSRDRFLVPTD